MSSAFRYTNVLKTKGQKVESYVGWKNKLLVSHSNGRFMIYKLTKNEQKNDYGLEKLSQHDKFTKKGITQMEVLIQKSILITLHDQVVELFELNNMVNFQTLITKKALLFSYNQKKTICVGINRKLIIFKWEKSNFVKKKEITIPDTPKTINFFSANKLCIGTKREYLLVNLREENPKPLFQIGKGGIPICTKISNNEMLLGKDRMCIFNDSDGKASREFGITWSEIPLNIFYFPPYVIAIFQNNIIVRTLYTNKYVQTIPISYTKDLKIIKSTNQSAYTMDKEFIWRLDAIPVNEQIHNLCEDGSYEEALQICNMKNVQGIDNLEETINTIKITYAFHLFHNKKFKKSMIIFSEVEIDPRRVLALYPFLVDFKLLKNTDFLIPETKNLEKDVQKIAIQNLIDYLTKIKKKSELDNYENKEEIITIIDTVLVKAYIKTNPGLLLPFLRLKNSCDLIETEKMLKKKNLEKELIALYKSKQKHREALELVEKEATKTNNLYQFIKYLENLNYEYLDLIFEYSKQIYQIDPTQCLEIFTFDNKTDQNPLGRNLPKKKIKKFFKEELPILEVPYLEYHIFNLGDKDPEFHNELLLSYQKQNEIIKKQMESETGNNIRQLAQKGIIYKKKMHDFILESKYYTPGKILTNFPMDDLFEERAILLSRINQHEQALEIYINKLKDSEKAEQYCIRHYNKDGETKDIFLLLIKKLLEAGENENQKESGNEKMLEQSFLILERHIRKIDPQKVFQILPKNIKVSKLVNYLRAVMKNLTEIKRTMKIKKNLYKSDYLNLTVERVQKRNKSLKINENTLCQVCGKRIGDSIFGKFPNGILAHMGCIQDKHICPKTQKNFNIYKDDF
ncbi:cnh domain containing [Anaeramoeba flamelloides]|uniref:Cnh domain containing n=1 Tax=Anaeramoeba flamelloides TaxID=1746091 RepID=A0AAV7YH24_9EUKA|nr:cnh domain containing [Anaeramoeba flamelloides]